MNSENVHRAIYRESLGDLIRDRVRERMCQQKRTCKDLGCQLSEEMGLAKSSTAYLVHKLKSFPGSALPISNNYVSVSPKERLRRASLVLNALNFDANEEVILRLRRVYGCDFIYPPGKRNDAEQDREPEKSWMDYL